MAKIHTLKIKNFRGIENFEEIFGLRDFICLIGRGDSGKSTILEAISLVLSSKWNVSFYDSDFHNCDTSEPIVIEASLYDVPEYLLQESKFGLYKRGLHADGKTIIDKIDEDSEDILTIRLTVDKELEPKWMVVNERPNQEPREINSGNRARLNVFLLSDNVDQHFSWNKGTPLYSLLKQENEDNSNGIVVEAMRSAKAQIDKADFENLKKVTDSVKVASSQLGVGLLKPQTSIDFKDISIANNRISLHDDLIPLKQMGKGSKRIVSIAIQNELSKVGGIVLVDEIEQGLEPDRAQHLVRTLNKNNTGQIFISTHSRDVVVEVNANDIHRVLKGGSTCPSFSLDLQGTIRSNPECLFSERIIVCEGATEVGMIRGIDAIKIKDGKEGASLHSVRYADGGGNTQFPRAKDFMYAGYEVSVFCDSDIDTKIYDKKKHLENTFGDLKTELEKMGCNIFDCQDGFSIEQQVFNDIPDAGILQLIDFAEKNHDFSIEEKLNSKYGGPSKLPADWKTSITRDTRNYLGELAKNGDWYKNISSGEYLGELCCKYLEEIKDSHLAKQVNQIIDWIGYERS